MLQLRDKRSAVTEVIKTACALKGMAKKGKAVFIVNDRAEVAIASCADGLHIGQGDLRPSLARKLMGSGKLLGISAGTFKEAKRARDDGADYIGVGPIFKSPVKRRLRPVGLKLPDKVNGLKIPFFCIGGISAANIGELRRRGIRNVAVIRAVCGAKNPARAAARLKEALLAI